MLALVCLASIKRNSNVSKTNVNTNRPKKLIKLKSFGLTIPVNPTSKECLI